MSSVFISHSRHDAAEADAVRAVLETAGIPCWIAPRDIPAGQPWPASIAAAIAQAPVVAICISAAANASAEVAREAIAALEAQRPILPIRLRDVAPAGNLAYLLAGVQWHDAFTARGTFDGASLPAIVRAIVAGGPVALEPRRAGAPRTVTGNLPSTATSLIGRDDDRAQIAALLERGRLVTLAGSAGVGKTRLALAVASDLAAAYPGGCCFVDFSALEDGEHVADAVANALGVPETARAELPAALAGALRERAALLVLDNCEHVIAAAAQLVHALLRATPVSVLATSREPLRVDGEAVFRVPALDAAAALALFAERAAAASPAFRLTDDNRATVAEICRSVDGVPYALELAAARVRALPPAEIAKRLSERFRLLTGGNRGALPRRQTLRAMIDWSHDLLAEAEQRVFRRLAAFSGGWTLAAAAAVCAGPDIDAWDVAEHVASLVDKSLVAHAGDGADVRYRFLETTRAYALEKLAAAGEGAAAAGWHLRWCTEAVEAAAHAWTALPLDAWRAAYLGDLDNARLALATALDGGTDPALGVRLATAAYRLWEAAARPQEGVVWCERALAAAGDDGSLPIAKLLLALATLLGDGAHVQRRLAAARRAAEIFGRHGDERGLIQALQDVAFASAERGEREAADAAAVEALARARALGDRRIISHALQTRSFTVDPADLDERRRLLEEAYAIVTELDDRRAGALLLMWLSELEGDAGNTVAARGRGTAALATLVALGDDVQAAFMHANLCAFALDAGDVEAADRARTEALRLAAGNVPLVEAIALQYAAEIALLRGDAARARRLKRDADAQLDALDVARGATELRSLRRLEAALEGGALTGAWPSTDPARTPQTLSDST